MAAGLVLAIGCVDRGRDDGGGGGIPAADFLDRAAEGLCGGDSVCLEAWRRDSQGIDLDGAARAGRITYDPAAADVCLSALEAADCHTMDMLNRLWPWQLAGLAGCNVMLQPRQGDRGPCATSIECVEGACFADDGETAPVCHPPRHAGDPCPSWDACASGLYCDGGGHCAAQVPTGASCTSGDQCLDEADCSQSICQPPLSAC